MSYINLIDKLTDLDRKRIENYISLFGVNKNDFIGLDQWLQNWSHANQKLFKLLGGKLIKEYDYLYTKNSEDIEREICDILLTMPMRTDYRDFYFDYVKQRSGFDKEDVTFFNHLLDADGFITDKIKLGIKFKKNGSKKVLQIQAGMKPMRALQKIMQYFDDWAWNWDHFEAFRLKHSMIFNDKVIKGKLCVSIHPLDYMTMSDNASNWTSCMSWTEDGCYHAGTIEMMNSNNVLCCYLKSDNSNFYFGGTHLIKANIEIKPVIDPATGEVLNVEEIKRQEEEYSWNDKKWRQLVYATKDIIMTGKSYPYYNETFTKDLLRNVVALAKQNVHWGYEYGPERYKDMIHISNNNCMEKNRNWIAFGDTIKHNIIWDTQGMYNDMLNDNYYNFWCFRNKVPHNKIINVSGKCNCLRCNTSIIWENDNYDGYNSYNERFNNCGSVLCPDCLEDFECNICNYNVPIEGLKTISINGRLKKVCNKCMQKYAFLCPECKKPLWIEDCSTPWCTGDTPYVIYNIDVPFEYFAGSGNKFCNKEEKNDINSERVYMCANCLKKMREEKKIVPVKVPYIMRRFQVWGRDEEQTEKHIKAFIPDMQEEAKKFIYSNLEKAPDNVVNFVRTGI